MRKQRITDLDIEIGKRIRHEREMAIVTQVELADKLGLVFQQVQKYENGTNRASGGRLLEIARALNIPVSNFFDGLEKQSAAHHARSPRKQELQLEARKILAAWDRLQNPVSSRHLLAFLKSLNV